MSHSSVCAKTNWHLLEGAVKRSGKLVLIYCYQDYSVMNTVSSICFNHSVWVSLVESYQRVQVIIHSYRV